MPSTLFPLSQAAGFMRRLARWFSSLLSSFNISQTVKITLSDVNHLGKKVAVIILLPDHQSLHYIFRCILNYLTNKLNVPVIYSYIQSKKPLDTNNYSNQPNQHVIYNTHTSCHGFLWFLHCPGATTVSNSSQIQVVSWFARRNQWTIPNS